ncbi:MAG TPA: anti-sigma factor [Streptosporangiaceae bacterium]
MTGPAADHARLGELAAGYALHALDPQEEADFLRHLPDCAECQDALAGFTGVTAALADSWPDSVPAEPDERPDPRLGERIMAAIADGPASGAPQSRPGTGAEGQPGTGAEGQPGTGAEGPPAAVASLAEHRHRHRLRAVAASAAAAAVVAAGAVWGGLAASGGGAPAAPEAGCAQAGTCREVVLTSADSRHPAGKVVVSGTTAWLDASGLKADNPARQIYVLWQITGKHTPVAVGSFEVTGHRGQPVRVGSLAVPFHSTWAFAVSIEQGRTIPATPSHPVALGQVPAS